MRGAVKRVEAGSAAFASAALAGAVGFAAYSGLGASPENLRLAVTAATAVAALLLGWTGLARIGRDVPAFAISSFELGAVQPAPSDLPTQETLELTDLVEQPLELDDVLHEIGPGARVVRLFDPAAMPSPGELRARIDRHLGNERPSAAAPDASEALIEALTQLRRSLR